MVIFIHTWHAFYAVSDSKADTTILNSSKMASWQGFQHSKFSIIMSDIVFAGRERGSLKKMRTLSEAWTYGLKTSNRKEGKGSSSKASLDRTKSTL